MEYQNFIVNIESHIAHVSFNRPDKANALQLTAWEEMQSIFESLNDNPEARVIVLSGEGKHFCAGIDLALLMDIQQFQGIKCEARKREKLRNFILKLQATVSSIEKCRKPVLAAIHRGCIGGGVDIIAACDMRYGTKDAYFTIKEVDMGLVADLGTVQRLPKILPMGIVSELAYTGRKMLADEAEKYGLINRVYEDKTAMLEGVMEIAKTIAAKSPIVVRGTKENLVYTRDHNTNDALNYIATWNAAMLMSNDIMEAFQASMQKRPAEFDN